MSAERFVREILTIVTNASLDDLMRMRASLNEPPQQPARTKRSRVKRVPKPVTPPPAAPPAAAASGRRDTTLISGRRPPELSFPAPTADSEPPVAERRLAPQSEIKGPSEGDPV